MKQEYQPVRPGVMLVVFAAVVAVVCGVLARDYWEVGGGWRAVFAPVLGVVAVVVVLSVAGGLAWWDRRIEGRRRRGECVRCGYSREGIAWDAPCPECGEGAL